MQRIGIITGLALEADIVAAEAKNWGEAAPRISLCGPGLARAAQHAEMLIHEGATALLSFGIAGGLSSEVCAGDLVIPDDVAGHNNSSFECNKEWRIALCHAIDGQLPVHGGRLISDQAAAATPERKRQLFDETGALAIDMESVAVAEAAFGAQVPFLAVRAIADPANVALPPIAATAINEAGKLNASAVAKSLIVHPTQITDLPALARQTNLAKASLSKLARLAGPGFGLF